MRSFRRVVTIGFAVGAGLGMTAGVATAQDLIPRDVLFGNPERAAVRISPDGTQLSWLAPVEGVLNIWVAPVNELHNAKPVTKDDNRGIRQYFWSTGGTHIIYLQDRGGDENWRVFSVDLATGKEICLTPMDGIAAQIQQVSHLHPDEILVGINNRQPQFHDIHRVNIKTGEMSLVQQNDGFLGFVTDDDYNVRNAVTFTPAAEVMVFNSDGEGGWVPAETIPSEDSLTTNLLGYDTSGKLMYMLDSRDRDTAALTATNTETGETKVLFSDDRADAGAFITHPTENRFLAAGATYMRTEWTVLDPAIKPDLDKISRLSGGDFSVTSQTLDNSVWIVAFTESDGPVKYYKYNRTSQTGEFLFTNRPTLEKYDLATMQSHEITSRDGLKLVSYLTLPENTDTDGNGVPEHALPMVLLVHGGPWARDTWGYNGLHQLLANRGYAVLSVNYRGSTGFGKHFINAADGEWAAKMHDDLIDAVDWAVDRGVADKDKVAIMGGSYGGYATLVGLTFTPDKFACGVDIVGPSSLITLMQNIPDYWYPFLPQLANRVGNPATEEGRKLLSERSPLNYVDKISKPLLIGQGANDPRVKQVEADQIVESMKQKNIPVTYVLYPDEGHGFARPENNKSFFAVTEIFLSEVLGGRYEEIGGDFQGASIQVPEGAQHVPGVSSALNMK
ncbi:MAG: S9 family peptidase [Phycisphaeraceae bacterium]|nr:S9 family peptidase [Phycisphaerales bacterium]MCB9859358.1 S9 family peptidase [Phycisphaeraceae bacterium]